jgi:hypothetical protein
MKKEDIPDSKKKRKYPSPFDISQSPVEEEKKIGNNFKNSQLFLCLMFPEFQNPIHHFMNRDVINNLPNVDVNSQILL